MFSSSSLAVTDLAVFEILQREAARQEEHLELIASENYVSPQVLQAQGSVLTNKYAEGYPHKRYYGGCEFVDQAEELAIERAKQLFGADYVNVQPHSGSQANSAAYAAVLTPGDVVLGMSLTDGGHLTHGSPVNFSGKLYKFYSYGVHADTATIDYAQAEELALLHRPKLIVTGFSAYSRIIDWDRFRAIADKINAYLLADIAHVAGLVAAGLYPSPLKIADITTTTTHKTLRGPRGGMIMAKANPELAKKLNSAVFPGGQGGPLMHVIAAKAVAFQEALQPEFITYQQQIIANAQTLAAGMLQRGYKIVSGGTDNHLMLVDLSPRNITGKAAEEALGRAYITVNKNTVPQEVQSPFITSGIRLGTPALTTRGMGRAECAQIATWICDILDDIDNSVTIQRIRREVIELCQRFPVYR